MKFDFKMPDKGGGEAKPPEAKVDAELPPTENDGDEGGEYTKADLGKMIASAVKSGDGEMIYEAVKKCMDSTPSDA